MFFVVDIESSGLTPWTGSLLTIGAVPVSTMGELLPDRLFLAVEPGLLSDPDTMAWWDKQSEIARNEAFAPGEHRWTLKETANVLAAWVETISGDETAYFVAHPASFDWMWMEFLFSTTGVKSPFHYRTLCVRSMEYGMDLANGHERTYGGSRVRERDVKPQVPHSAASDAVAEAINFARRLRERR